MSTERSNNIGANETPESAEEQGRRASNVELFLDLVFVFAITQIASLIAHRPSWSGFGKGALIAWLVWWLWSQFSWTGSAIDLETSQRGQFGVLLAVPSALVMAVALPEAFGSGGSQFAVAYCITRFIAIGLLASEMWRDPAARATFLSYAGFAAIGPCAVAAGGFMHGTMRIVLWTIGALLGFIGALSSGRAQPEGGGWSIDPAHFSERHALFVIISLGEVLVAAGTNASEAGAANHLIFGLVAPVLVACVMWWVYFAFIPRVTEDALRRVSGEHRARVARDMFSFMHFPIVFGIILYAVVAKHVVLEPSHHLGTFDQRMLAASMLCLLGGFMGIHYQYNRGVALERVTALVLLVVLALGFGKVLPSAVLVLIAAVVLTVMHAVTIARFRGRIEAGLLRAGFGDQAPPD